MKLFIIALFPLIATAQVTGITGDPEPGEVVYVAGSGLAGSEVQVCIPQEQAPFSDKGGFVKLRIPSGDVSGMTLWAGTNSFSLSDAKPWPPRNTTKLTWTTPAKHTDARPILNLTGYVVEYGRGDFSRSAEVQGLSYTVKDLPAGTWQFRVRAVADGEIGEVTEAVNKQINGE